MVLFPKPMYRNLGRCLIFFLRACAGPACGSTPWPVVTQAPFRVSSLRLAKRSRALRRRNPARDSQVDRAPMAQAPPPLSDRGASSFHPSDTGAMPQKISGSGAEPQPSFSTHGFCRRAIPKKRKEREAFALHLVDEARQIEARQPEWPAARVLSCLYLWACEIGRLYCDCGTQAGASCPVARALAANA